MFIFDPKCFALAAILSDHSNTIGRTEDRCNKNHVKLKYKYDYKKIKTMKFNIKYYT